VVLPGREESPISRSLRDWENSTEVSAMLRGDPHPPPILYQKAWAKSMQRGEHSATGNKCANIRALLHPPDAPARGGERLISVSTINLFFRGPLAVATTSTMVACCRVSAVVFDESAARKIRGRGLASTGVWRRGGAGI